MKKWTMILLAVAMTIPVMTSGAFAFRSLLTEVNTTCGTASGCGICHVNPSGGGPLNAAGTAYFNAGNDPCYFCPTAATCAPAPPPPPPPPTCTDADTDGFFKESNCGTAVDCNDNDPSVYPGTVEICNDSKDNDCDGKTDCADTGCANDPACAAPPPPPPTPTCTDADGDGYYKETGCGTSVDCNDNNPNINQGMPENCTDGIDNDCDGLIDCADNDCTAATNCAPAVTPEDCNDGIDNDGDGMVDCADSDCNRDPVCTAPVDVVGVENTPRFCRDGLDNDGDGLVDCDDPDCETAKTCIEGRGRTCNDGVDNDRDGLVDCDDPDCADRKPCLEGKGMTCNDGIDNDNDGLVDCDDPDCARNRSCRDSGMGSLGSAAKTAASGVIQMKPAVTAAGK